MLTLHVVQGPDRGRTFQLPDNEPQLIGRSSEALPITDRSVSRRHAELTPDGTDWYVRDLDSANGTWLNGERIADRVKLSPGDQIRCGSSLFIFGLVHDDERPSSPIRVIGPEDMDATVEQTIPSQATMDELAGDGTPALRAGSHGSESRGTAIHHLRILYEITAITGQTVDRDELLNRIMDLIFEEFHPDRGFILLQDDPSERPDPVVIRYRERPRTIDEGHIPVSRTIVQHTLRKGEGILSSNAMNDTRFRSGDSVMRYGIRSAICVPIRGPRSHSGASRTVSVPRTSAGSTRSGSQGERIFGVIHIDSSVANFSFTDAQLRLLSAVGMQTGLALTNAELIATRVEHERLAAIGETVASLSHAIKNILQGLRGGADAVELALNREDLRMAREAWPIVARNLDRIYSLTMNMLAFSKRREPELELESPHTVIADVVELIQPQCERRRVALVQDLDDAMPPVPMDGAAVHQAIMNLLQNALEAVPDKKGIISIRTRFDASRHRAEIHIGDNGPGVAADQREKIFEPFHSTKGQRGTGLGLAVARKIAREHGGDVMLGENVDEEGRPRPGALFIMTLPIEEFRDDLSDTRLPRSPADTRWAP